VTCVTFSRFERCNCFRKPRNQRAGRKKSGSDAAGFSIAYKATFSKEEFVSHSSELGDSPSKIYTSKVAVEMHDSAHKAPVWSGTVSRISYMQVSPDKRQAEITKAIKNY
jgi:hypothetical protein